MAPSSSIPPWTFGTFSQSIPVWNQFDASQSFNSNLPRVPLPTSIPNRSQEAIQYIPTWNQQSASQSTSKPLSPIGKDPLNQSNENNDMTLDVPAKSIDEMLKNVIGNSSRRYDQQSDKTKMSLSNAENDDQDKSIDEMLKNVLSGSSARYDDQKSNKKKMSSTTSENSPTRKSSAE